MLWLRLQETGRLGRARAVVDNGHKSPGHSSRILVLDDVAPIHNARRTLLDQFLSAFEKKAAPLSEEPPCPLHSKGPV